MPQGDCYQEISLAKMRNFLMAVKRSAHPCGVFCPHATASRYCTRPDRKVLFWRCYRASPGRKAEWCPLAGCKAAYTDIFVLLADHPWSSEWRNSKTAHSFSSLTLMEREKGQGERPEGEDRGVSVEEAELGFLLRQIYYLTWKIRPYRFHLLLPPSFRPCFSTSVSSYLPTAHFWQVN